MIKYKGQHGSPAALIASPKHQAQAIMVSADHCRRATAMAGKGAREGGEIVSVLKSSKQSYDKAPDLLTRLEPFKRNFTPRLGRGQIIIYDMPLRELRQTYNKSIKL